MANYKFDEEINFDGFQVTQDVDVSAVMPDARVGIWTLYDLSNVEISGAIALIDAATVRLTVDPALPAGNYRLIGLS